METFCAVGDEQLCALISAARKRVVYVAPGISGDVARAVGTVLKAPNSIDVTIVLDPDEDVCRLGYGHPDGLKTLQQLAESHHVGIRKQHGLRIGVLLVDDDVLLWAPTPQSVEAAPTLPQQPNGLRLGRDPIASLERAIAPEGTDTVPSAGEIGKTAVTPTEVMETLKALKANPVIPVALSQVTRVFSTKLQFVELEVKGAKLSKTGLTVPKDQLNVDASDVLKGLIEAKLRAFGDLRRHAVQVPAYTRAGEPVKDDRGKLVSEPMSEADLDAFRRDIERRFLYSIPGHGTLIARDQKREFQKCIDAYTEQLKAHAKGLRGVLRSQSATIVVDAVTLVKNRASHAAKGPVKVDAAAIEKSLGDAVERLVQGQPSVTTRYKDVTYEHTQDKLFHELVRKALPPDVQKKLGNWDVHFQAAKEQKPAARESGS